MSFRVLSVSFDFLVETDNFTLLNRTIICFLFFCIRIEIPKLHTYNGLTWIFANILRMNVFNKVLKPEKNVYCFKVMYLKRPRSKKKIFNDLYESVICNCRATHINFFYCHHCMLVSYFLLLNFLQFFKTLNTCAKRISIGYFNLLSIETTW